MALATSSSSSRTTNKAKATGVSASSFLDLKAELSVHQQEFLKNKAAGKTTIRGLGKPVKKPTVWSRSNKGVNSRDARDVELEIASRRKHESARAVLERKAEIYEKLKKGKSGGLSEKQYDALLVDFDSKPVEDYSSSEDEVDESLTVPKRPEDDPVIEYVDELGRTRTAPRSEVPRELLHTDPQDDPIIEYQDEFGRTCSAPRSTIPRHLLPPDDDDDPYVIYNPVNHFPTFEPSAERVAQIEKEFAEENDPLNLHYDASKEVRAKGAGFYAFSADEETRQRQMEDLRLAREETERTRQDAGAVDMKPGDIEGMQAEGSKSRVLEKRKRELEERRKLVEAKRRKIKGSSDVTTPAEPSVPTVHSAQSHTTVIQPKNPSIDDPFAAVEAKSSSRDIADDFLAQLEREILKSTSQ